MSTAGRVARALVLFAAVVGCRATPSIDSARAVSSAEPSPPEAMTAGSVGVVGACCPDSDSAISALMDRYERTPEAERTPEIALWAYRMSSGLTDQERIVVRDSASWAALWPRI